MLTPIPSWQYLTIKTGSYFRDVVKEIGSGLNGHRSAMLNKLTSLAVKVLFVPHQDSLHMFV